MLHFGNDYNQGMLDEILEVLIATNKEVLSGYGFDKYTQSAVEKIKKACNREDIEISLLTGGTQTNQIVISSILKSYEGVISADSGHINKHEAGAIEYTGHKVLTIKNDNGKINSVDLKKYLEDFYNDVNHAHSVYPGMVFITHPTEYGSMYSKSELEEISKICRQYNIPLYLDGARLAYALAVENTDVNLETISNLCDIFYIGGTKLGLLCGEALVFTKNNRPKNFMTIIKQHGALLAKSRILGVQFDRFFTDNLYYNVGKETLKKSEKLKNIIKEKGYSFYIESPTNQQFIIYPNNKLEKLSKNVIFSKWDNFDETHSIIRLVVSWSTKYEEIEQLRDYL